MDDIKITWRESSLYSECSWHQLSPYIGRMKSTMAKSLVKQFTRDGDVVYDPFVGAGTVALEAWIEGRHVAAGDLNPYAYVLSKAKVTPLQDIHDAKKRLDMYWLEACKERKNIDLRQVPIWVRSFFHPETLRETLAIRNVLSRHRQYFLFSCLLGILHHWRPGFLSYPSSHTVPYLKNKMYPPKLHPELYAYREVYPRLLAKVQRAFKRVPKVNRQLVRKVEQSDASMIGHNAKMKVSAIITSPPYMNALSYARDNRLRLWFLGVSNYKMLEPKISPSKTNFLTMMRNIVESWSEVLVKDGACVLVLGAVRRDGKYHNLPAAIQNLVHNTPCGLKLTAICRNTIPDIRRARINCCSTREETVLVFRKGRC